MSYYNTNNEEGSTLSCSRENTQNQEELILTIFNKEDCLSPEEVLYVCNEDHNYPITSIRRAMTDLTSKGLLIKTNIFKKGKYGKMTHTWKLSNGEVR